MTAASKPLRRSSESDAALARDSGRRLARLARTGRVVPLRVGAGARAETLNVPAGAVRLLAEILDGMAAGRTPSVVTREAEFTTQQAADALAVSRPYLVRLLDEGKIPSRKVGAHRRVRCEDVLAYKAAIDARRRKALDALAAEAEALDLGY